MRDAHYTLKLGEFIDTVFENRIGHKHADPRTLKSVVEDITLVGNELNLRLRVGGIAGSSWSIEVEIHTEDGIFITTPAIIKGEIANNGTALLDKNFPLKEK
jgi:hypothetical protein